MTSRVLLGETTQKRLRSLLDRQPLLFVFLAVASGILLDASAATLTGIPAGRRPLIWLGLVAIAGAVWFWQRKRMFTWMGMFCVLILPVGGAWHAVRDSVFQSASVLSIITEESQPVILTGVLDRPITLRRHPLAESPSRRGQSPWQTQFHLKLTSAKVRQTTRHFDGQLLVVCDGRLDELLPGDELVVYGSMRKFAAPSNPGEKDLRPIYRRRGLHGRVDCDGAEQIEKNRKTGSLSLEHWLYRQVASMARSSRETLMSYVDEKSSSLALALVIGQREFVDDRTRDSLLETGTAHLLSVSGLHLAIVVGLFAKLAFVLQVPGSLRLTLTMGVCVLYTAVTGGRPPVVRAAILVGALVVSLMVQRPRQPINILSAAAIALIAWNPENVFSVGVHLSFLAVATVMMCGRRFRSDTPAIEQELEREERLDRLAESSLSLPAQLIRSWGQQIIELFRLSVCVTAISIPLVWHQFHVVSLISILINVLLGFLLLIALPSGVVTVVASSVAQPVAILSGLCCDYSLRAIRFFVESAAALRFGHFWLPAPPTWWVIVFYVVLVSTLWWTSNEKVKWFRRSWILIWGIGAVIMATHGPSMEEGSVEATFVDLGHGTCVVVRFSPDDVWLYDCGRMGNDNGTSRYIDATLWSLGVTHLDAIVLSHADSDHYNAIPSVLRRFGVNRIVTPPGMIETPESGLGAIRVAIKKYNVPIEETFADQHLLLADRKIDVLHPPENGIQGSDNANSLVLSIRQSGTELILPGDLEPPGTEVLINRKRPQPGSVLMAPHHGSLTMDAQSVLEWSKPLETIVSGGQRAKRPAVHQMLSFTGSGVHVTADVGAIRVKIDPRGKIEIRAWNLSPW